MQNILSLIEKDRNIRKRMTIVLCILSVFALVLTLILFIRPAHSLVDKADCGITEHTHTPECYSEHKKCGESVLVCCSDLLSEELSHIHDDFCYDENGKIICPLSEYEHIHTDECYDENGVQICGAAFHQHGEECFRILVENDSALVLECGKVSHTHCELCLASQEDMQEDFAETQNIEFDFEETEIIEPEMEIFEPEINNQIAMLSDGETVDIDTSQGFELKSEHISSVKLEYKNEKGVWVTVNNGMENIRANASMRIEVKYKNINKSEIANHYNQIVYSGIPAWMNPNSTANIYQDNTVVATLSVGGGNAVITFNQDYLDGLTTNATIDGTFSVEGSADWREINNSSNLVMPPSLNLSFEFEGDLSSKYGNFEVTKHNTELIEVRENGETGKITHTYLKYELNVKSLESNIAIPDICITDILSTENWLNLNDVIVGNGYVGVTGDNTDLGSIPNAYNPYETGNKITDNPNTYGTVVLDNNNLKWNIANLQPQEERTLVYYVELNEKYVGSGSAGTLRNEAIPESKGFKKESVRDEFIPKADVDIKKTQENGGIHVNEFGNGTIDYTVVVTAASDNSYTITDACIKDAFRDGMNKYVDLSKNPIKVVVNGTEQEVNIATDGFTVPIDELKAGASVTITYSVPVKGLFSDNNGDVSLSNHASFVGGNKDGKIKHGYTFNGSGVTTTVSHNQWMRKLNGRTIPEDETIPITNNNNNVYNYDKSKSNATEFTVPQNAQEYTVIVNEDGTWDMSGTTFVDHFLDSRIAYTGYLKIDEFNRVEEIGENNNLNDSDVLSILNNQIPTKTVWVNIDGLNRFEVIPTNYGLTKENKVYRLTYYAAVKSTETNIKNIVVANDFSIIGTIGIGDNAIIFNGVHTVVSSTLTGSASYDFDKESLFYEKKYYTSGHGEIYWVIRANGTLPKDLHIKDQPDKNTIGSDSLVGVYLGDKDYDFSSLTSYEELNDALSTDMRELEGGTSKYFYNLQTISSYADLDNHDFAIFSRGEDRSGYLTGNQNGDNKIKGESLDTQVTFGTDVETTEIVQTWHFQLAENETDKFYIYYTDSSNNNHYMHISSRNANISTDPGDPLTVIVQNNQIKIFNPVDDEALNWYGNNNVDINYSGWDNGNGANNWQYLGTLDNSTKYNYKPQEITNTDELDGKQFAIITPGTHNSGLLVGGASDKKADALTGVWYTTKFSDNPPTITRTSPLQKWTFDKMDGTDDEFQVYYTENGQQYYLELGNDSATTTVTPTTVKISCKDGKIRLTTQNGSMALDWNGGGQDAQTVKPYYSTWNNRVDSDNRLHYVVTEEIISASGTSNYAYSWDNKGSIKINKNTVIDTDKSMYIIMRTQPNQELSGRNSKTFSNEVGIIDDTTGQFYMLDNASYIYTPNLPLYKEGMVAAYWDDKNKNWTIQSDQRIKGNLSSDRDTIPKLNTYFDPNGFVKANGSGLYVEWLMNVNWDGTIEGDVILTDYLNHKMEPVLLRQFNANGSHSYGKIDELEKNPDWTSYTTHDIPFYYNEKTGELKVCVKNLQKSQGTNNSVVNLQLICRVTDPDVIFSGINSALTNNAELTRPDGTFIGKHTDTHIIKPTYSIAKKGTGTEEGDGNDKHYVSNKLTYTIEINPLAEDLMVDKDTLPVLIDEMKGDMELVGTVDIYEKVGDSDETKLDIKYSIKEFKDENKKQIIFENLPDKKHLIITYKTKVNVKPSDDSDTKNTTDISNIAYWQGYKPPTEPQCSEEFWYALSGSVSSRDYPVVVINKLDFYDNSIALGGAEFEIRKVNTDGTVDTSPIELPTTDNEGKIYFEDNQLSWNTVYQIKETKAPTDYVLDSTPKYFMIVKVNQENQESHHYTIDNNGKMNIDNKSVDVIIDYASDNSTDLELTIYNKKAHIRVNKVFNNESGGDTNHRYGTYRFGLYENPANANSTVKPVQILSITYSDKGTSYALDGKATSEPVFTKARAGVQNYIYELNEKYEPINNGSSAFLNGYSFDVTYSSNNVVGLSTETTVTITNKEHPIYLPMTGGIGFKKYYLTAFYLTTILLALATVIVKIRRKCK